MKKWTVIMILIIIFAAGLILFYKVNTEKRIVDSTEFSFENIHLLDFDFIPPKVVNISTLDKVEKVELYGARMVYGPNVL